MMSTLKPNITAFLTRNEKATGAPYRGSHCIALAGEVHANRLRKSCTTEIAECLLDDKSV